MFKVNTYYILYDNIELFCLLSSLFFSLFLVYYSLLLNCGGTRWTLGEATPPPPLWHPENQGKIDKRGWNLMYTYCLVVTFIQNLEY